MVLTQTAVLADLQTEMKLAPDANPDEHESMAVTTLENTQPDCPRYPIANSADGSFYHRGRLLKSLLRQAGMTSTRAIVSLAHIAILRYNGMQKAKH
jgi:hypothetical protein